MSQKSSSRFEQSTAGNVRCYCCASAVEALNDEMWICPSCRAISYFRMPSEEDLAELYGGQAAHDQDALDKSDCEYRAFGATSKTIATQILKNSGWFDAPAKTLEIGPGQGEMTDVLVSRSSDVFVLEPFADVDYSAKGVGHYKDLADLPRDQKFEWIFMVEVVEHLRDPVSFLTHLGKHLSPNGKLVITTPNSSGWKARLKGSDWDQAKNPVHINLFGPKSLTMALSKSGYRSIRRSLKPVAFKKSMVANALQAPLQLMGIDGSLRVIVSDWHRP